jgi:ABC-type oligopeptide transport system substrate-binding subunit
MTMLVDRERICKEVFLGYATVATDRSSRTAAGGSEASSPGRTIRGREKAAQRAGLQRPQRRRRARCARRHPFQFKLTIPHRQRSIDRAVFLMKDIMAAAGIAMEPIRSTWPILQDRLENKDFDAISLRWGGGKRGGRHHADVPTPVRSPIKATTSCRTAAPNWTR